MFIGVVPNAVSIQFSTLITVLKAQASSLYRTESHNRWRLVMLTIYVVFGFMALGAGGMSDYLGSSSRLHEALELFNRSNCIRGQIAEVKFDGLKVVFQFNCGGRNDEKGVFQQTFIVADKDGKAVKEVSLFERQDVLSELTEMYHRDSRRANLRKED
jgi:hypothetical protein